MRFNMLKVFVSIILLSLQGFAFAQSKSSYQIGYFFKYQLNKTDTNSKVSENMELTISDGLSEYQSINKRLKDSIVRAMREGGTLDSRTIPKSRLEYLIIKNRTANTQSFAQQMGVTKIYFTDELNLFNWQLQSDKKEILGYACNKATVTFAGRNYTAWYTTAIPIPDGPYKFNGLPGLILEITDSQNQFQFVAQSIRQIPFATIDPTPPSGSTKMTKKEYLAFLDKVKDNPALLYESDKIKFAPEMAEKIRTNAKAKFERENNQLEIY